MARRALRDDAGMDLFPFMAVLICTVGALIMLLVVMVQQARVKATMPNQDTLARQVEIKRIEQQQQAELKDHEQRKQLAADASEKFDELKWRADLLRTSYDKTVEQLGRERLKLSHLESNTRELSAKATNLQAEADLIAAAATKDAEGVAASTDKIEELREAIASAKAEFEAKTKELNNLDPKYVLIPYNGQSGTNRRPIYIECLPDRVVLQPENVVLIGEDFLEPLAVENPLAQALRAKREFLQNNGLIGEEDEPYPLLVVRPGAATTYAAARAAMKEWEAEFGYELVESTIELDYLESDRRLKELLADIVIESRGKRRMMRSLRTSMKPRRRERLRPSASGGFERVESGYDGELKGFANGDPFATGDSRYGRYGQAGSSQGRRGGIEPDGNGHTFASGTGDATNLSTNNFGNGSSFGSGNNRLDGPAGKSNQAGEPRTGPSSSGTGSQFDAESGGQAGAGGPNDVSDFVESKQGGPVGNRLRSTIGSSNPYRSGAAGNAQRAGQGRGGASPDATGSGGQGATGSGGSSMGASSASASAAAAATMGSSLAQNRGVNWAVPGVQNDAVAIRRPIYIVCDTEKLSLLPERGTAQELEVYRHGGSVAGVVDPFVKSVKARLASWGIAGDGVYWKPVLQIQVNPGAETAYDQLLRLLDDSGIEVTRKL